MATSKHPVRVDDELSEEEKAILRERLKTIEEDAKHAIDAREALQQIRRQLHRQRASR